MKNILIINPFGIGDVIFSTPLAELLKKNYPDIRVGYICNKRAAEIVASDPNVDKVFVYDSGDYDALWRRSKTGFIRRMASFWASIRKERFEAAIDLSLSNRYGPFLALMGVKKRVGPDYKHRNIFLTRRVKIDGYAGKHVVDHYLDALGLLGIAVKDHSVYPRVYASGSSLRSADKFLKAHGIAPGDLVIGMIPGGGASWGLDADLKRWGGEKFAVLADRLIARHGAKVILLGDKDDADLCGIVRKLMRRGAIDNSGKTSVGELAGILAKCGVVIANDGGPLHIAAGLGAKTVSIYGPVDEKVYGPYPSGAHHEVISKKDLACRPCYKKFRYNKCGNRVCLDAVTVEEVMAAFERTLKESDEPSRV